MYSCYRDALCVTFAEFKTGYASLYLAVGSYNFISYIVHFNFIVPLSIQFIIMLLNFPLFPAFFSFSTIVSLHLPDFHLPLLLNPSSCPHPLPSTYHVMSHCSKCSHDLHFVVNRVLNLVLYFGV